MDVKELLVQSGCLHEPLPDRLLSYHFVVGTEHRSGYCALEPLLHDLNKVGRLSEALAIAVHRFFPTVQTILTPSITPGPLLAFQLASHLMPIRRDAHVVPAWTWKKAASDQLKLDPDIAQNLIFGRQVLLLQGVAYSPHTLKALADLVLEVGGTVAGAVAIAARDTITSRVLGVPTFLRLARFSVGSWSSHDCTKFGPCSRRVPIVLNPMFGTGMEHQRTHRLPSKRYRTLRIFPANS